MNAQMELSQRQTISFAMMQSAEILQMSSEELSDFVKEVALENPMAELTEVIPQTMPAAAPSRLQTLEWLARFDEQNRGYRKADSGRDQQDGIPADVSVRRGETLQDAIRLQLLGKGYSSREIGTFEYLAGCLDDRGYFTMPVQEAAEQLCLPEAEILGALEILRGLEPAGVFARDLKDCLLLQLGRETAAAMGRLDSDAEAKADTVTDTDTETERRILTDHLEELAENRLPKIAAALEVPLERVIAAKERIRALNPKPSAGYDCGSSVPCIVPDVSVTQSGGQFEVRLNGESCPELGVNSYYLRLFKEQPDQEVKEYLEKKYDQISRVQKYIGFRNQTLRSLCESILGRQKEFFLYGEAELKPFRMREAAEEIGVHESTVCRAVKGKYLQCRWGTYPLSWFFPSKASRKEDTEEISSRRIKTEIQGLIASENKKKPMSDQVLSNQLALRGYPVTRRTVTKYREAMGIGNYRARRVY